ncbi:PEGA domain-containing protein [Kribbella sp. VKM Ac-2527]|uniref:PEGA domain-containing protein n=1 Tax=Kribbella caucasensis TaxID=2512215 RepID=A0A4V3CB53_9ACTN|nr:PEGA domain-containing protein [Kribbella sp. VKM Ac-2527]TDO54640.1 PEGA domain-containing protein [Kribbella sp. VKM Ac-2527]
MEENRRVWLLGAVVIGVVVVLLGGYLVFRGGAESKLTVKSIPNDLTLTLDGKPIKANGDVKVRAGEHTLTATRDGFQSYTETVTAKGGDPLFVKMYLFSNDPAGRAWEQDNPDQALEAEAEAGRRYDEIQKRLRSKYPILLELPYIGPGFKATYTDSKSDPDNPEAISLKIQLFDSEGKTKALEWIEGHGYDPATLDIIYTR